MWFCGSVVIPPGQGSGGWLKKEVPLCWIVAYCVGRQDKRSHREGGAADSQWVEVLFVSRWRCIECISPLRHSHRWPSSCSSIRPWLPRCHPETLSKSRIRRRQNSTSWLWPTMQNATRHPMTKATKRPGEKGRCLYDHGHVPSPLRERLKIKGTIAGQMNKNEEMELQSSARHDGL